MKEMADHTVEHPLDGAPFTSSDGKLVGVLLKSDATRMAADVAPCTRKLISGEVAPEAYAGEAGRLRRRTHLQLGEGSHRSGTHRTNEHHPMASKNPPTTSLGQCAPAQTRAVQPSTIATAAATQGIHR